MRRLSHGAWVLAACAGLALALPVRGQQTNPVYPDDSPVARETLARVGENAAGGNVPEAVREIQRLLDDHPDRVVASPEDDDLFVSVRARVHEFLLASPAILEQWRASETVRAQQELDAGKIEAVERSRLLTAPGFEAALRVAQLQMESSGFEGARLTLEQLERHPERKGKGAAEAAALLATLAPYIDRPEVWERAQRWSREAGEGGGVGEGGAIQKPPALTAERAAFHTGAPRVDAVALPDTPLWSMPLAPETVPPDGTELNMDADGSLVLAGLWVMPTVVGDTVYVNDGTFVTARDRFTLQPRWSVRPSAQAGAGDPFAARRAYTARSVEDTASVSVQGRTIVCTMGVAQSGGREGDEGTYALDAATGRILWSLTVSALDPQLESTSVRGPAMIEGDTVVLMARKGAQGRRMVGLYAVGVSIADGSLRWVRPIGSAGAILWGSRADVRYSGATLDRGVVYVGDNLGVMAAVEAATGRPVWVRRTPVPATAPGMGIEFALAWQWSSPIAHKDTIVALSPDRQGLVQVDRGTGEVLARRAPSAIGNPSYILAAGGHFAAVSNDAIVFGDLDEVAAGAVNRSRIFAPQIRGRVVSAGPHVAVPVFEGVAVVDPAKPAADVATLRMVSLGNVLPVSSQILAVDGDTLHSYLTWQAASTLLDARMRENPSDPEPAITYAELAYRADRHDQIAGAADKALAAIERDPTSEPSRASRRRLFTVLRDMVEYSQQRWDAPPQQPPAAAQEQNPRRNRRGTPALAVAKPDAVRPVLNLVRMSEALDRMARAAQSAEDQISHLLALGRLRVAESKPALAAESYQRILADPVLAAASWKGPAASIRAELETTRRIRDLAIEHGQAAYGLFDAQAERELAAIPSGAPAEALERLGRQYPASGAGAMGWLRAADAHEVSDRLPQAVTALREALATAEAASAAGLLKDSATLSEAAGRLVTRMAKLDQDFSAAQLLTSLRSRHAALLLVDHGAPIAIESLQAQLAQRLAAMERFPRIGPKVTGIEQVLPGWTILQPRNRDHPGRPCEHLMMISRGEMKVALWGFAAAQPAPGASPAPSSSQFGQVWSRAYSGEPPVLLRTEPGAIYLWWERTEANQGPVIEKIGAVGGETLWRSEPLRSLFAADPALERRREILRNTVNTPIDGAVRLSDVVVTMDERVIVMAERSGRIAAFERSSGKLLWTDVAPVGQINDITGGAGLIVVGGTPAIQGERVVGNEQQGVILAYDAGSGALRQRFGEGRGQLRWLRMGAGDQQGAVIAGFAAEVSSFDSATARVNWSLTGGPAFSSIDAWTYGERLYLLDQQRDLWQVSAVRGERPEAALDTQGRLMGDDPIQGTLMADGKSVSFATQRGLVAFEESGQLSGIDAIAVDLNEEIGFLPAAIGESHMALVEATPRQATNEQVIYSLHILDTQSAMLQSTRSLQLEMPPKRIAVIDGHVAVTAGNVTILLAAPVDPR